MTKRLKSHRVAVAGALLYTLVSMSACVLPQNDDPLPALPTLFKNHRPQILLSQIFPDPLGAKVFTPAASGCQQTDFLVAVADEDTGDKIRAAWRSSTFDGSERSGWQVAPLQNVGSSTVERPDKLVPPPHFFEQSPLRNAGDYRIDVVVSDSTFTTMLDTNGHEQLIEDSFLHNITDGGIATEPAGVDSFTWTVSAQGTCQ
jgi:hypothetical protein